MNDSDTTNESSDMSSDDDDDDDDDDKDKDKDKIKDDNSEQSEDIMHINRITSTTNLNDTKIEVPNNQFNYISTSFKGQVKKTRKIAIIGRYERLQDKLSKVSKVKKLELLRGLEMLEKVNNTIEMNCKGNERVEVVDVIEHLLLYEEEREN